MERWIQEQTRDENTSKAVYSALDSGKTPKSLDKSAKDTQERISPTTRSTAPILSSALRSQHNDPIVASSFSQKNTQQDVGTQEKPFDVSSHYTSSPVLSPTSGVHILSPKRLRERSAGPSSPKRQKSADTVDSVEQLDDDKDAESAPQDGQSQVGGEDFDFEYDFEYDYDAGFVFNDDNPMPQGEHNEKPQPKPFDMPKGDNNARQGLFDLARDAAKRRKL